MKAALAMEICDLLLECRDTHDYHSKKQLVVDKLNQYAQYQDKENKPPRQHDLIFDSQVSSRLSEIAPSSQNTIDTPPIPFQSNADQRFEWTSKCYHFLRTSFSLQHFRPNQLDAINSVLSGKDTFVLMPTGGGKSLCFQLPALFGGLTVVITPLLSLMMDQVSSLKSKNIPVGAFHGGMTSLERKELHGQLNQYCPLRLLYCTPEMLCKSSQLQQQLHQLKQANVLKRFIIDEAHCLSQWGHDFRPDYKQLSFLKTFQCPIMALTATANQQVRQDIISTLNIQPVMIKQSFNRPNLIYKCQLRKTSYLNEMKSFIQLKYPTSCGIIYCQTRQKCEDLAKALNSACYHAGLSKIERMRVQEQWQSGQVKIIVATIAFGMGIDKANVRFVIHQALPSSVEGYYQETGRAGRDGLQSECLLFYNYGDTKTLESLIQKGDGGPMQKERQLSNVRQMLSYCENKMECRRQQILAYFDETFNKADCKGTCDNCDTQAQYTTVEVGREAKSVVRLLRSINVKVTAVHCCDVLRGSRVKKITSVGHDRLAEFGQLKSWDKVDVMRLIHKLVEAKYLRETTEMTKAGFNCKYLYMGDKGMSIRPNEDIQMTLAIEKKEKRPVKKPKTLKTALKQFRSEGLTDAHMEEILRRKPANMKEVLQLSFMTQALQGMGVHQKIMETVQAYQ